MNPVIASETTSYSYDARGRLVGVVRSGTVNNGISECYAQDKTGNRTTVATGTGLTCSGTTTTPSVSFSVNNISATEGGNLVFTITKTGTASGTTTVDYATANGTAIAGSDYTAKSNTLTFLSGATSKNVSIATTDDTLVEGAETIFFNLSNPTGGATIADAQAIGTINDNDTGGGTGVCAGVTFSIASVGAVTEGALSKFTITKSGTATGSCSISYATANLTATAGSDYTAKSGSLTFLTSATSKTLSVSTTDDTAAESAETFKMTLSSPTGGATLGTPSSATATINDNDSSGGSGSSFSISDASGIEGDTLVFTVTRSGSLTGTATVNFATSNGTALAGYDYSAASGTLTFGANVATQSIFVTTLTDSNPESTETFNVNLTGASTGSTITDATGVGSIADSCAPVATSPDPGTGTTSDSTATDPGAISYAVATC